jgi:hypothetical protein
MQVPAKASEHAQHCQPPLFHFLSPLNSAQQIPLYVQSTFCSLLFPLLKRVSCNCCLLRLSCDWRLVWMHPYHQPFATLILSSAWWKDWSRAHPMPAEASLSRKLDEHLRDSNVYEDVRKVCICCLLSTICRLLSTVCCLLSALYSLLSALCSLPSAPCPLPHYFLLSALCSLLSTSYSLLSNLYL